MLVDHYIRSIAPEIGPVYCAWTHALKPMHAAFFNDFAAATAPHFAELFGAELPGWTGPRPVILFHKPTIYSAADPAAFLRECAVHETAHILTCAPPYHGRDIPREEGHTPRWARLAVFLAERSAARYLGAIDTESLLAATSPSGKPPPPATATSFAAFSTATLSRSRRCPCPAKARASPCPRWPTSRPANALRPRPRPKSAA